MKDVTMEKRPDLDREFASSTTLHGIARVIENTRISVKLLWLSILMLCLGVCVWQVTDRFQRFLKYEANTAVSVEYVRDLNFPAVTICNFNRYRKSALTPADEAALNVFFEYAEYDYDSYDDQDPDETPDDMEPANFSYSEFTKRAGFVLDEKTLLECEWRGRKQSCNADNFTHGFTSFGNCWTFNSGKENTGILNQIQPGSGNGLKMVINIQQDEYTELIQNGNLEAGLKVLVHDQETPPSVDSEGFAIAPGVHAFVGVRKIEYNNLESPWGKCKTQSLDYFRKYTRSGCDIECRAKHILKDCDCRLVRHPVNGSECTPKQVKNCATPTLAKLKSGALAGCDCPVPCNYSEFRTALSMATMPSNKLLSEVWNAYATEEFRNYTDEISETYVRDNWILLDVYYESMNFEKYVQTEAITLSGFISDIGGQLGLFLGASFITMAEILSYLCRKAGRMMTCCSQRHTVKPQKQEPDEAVDIKELPPAYKSEALESI